jgi:hypothetical protein
MKVCVSARNLITVGEQSASSKPSPMQRDLQQISYYKAYEPKKEFEKNEGPCTMLVNSRFPHGTLSVAILY